MVGVVSSEEPSEVGDARACDVSYCRKKRVPGVFCDKHGNPSLWSHTGDVDAPRVRRTELSTHPDGKTCNYPTTKETPSSSPSGSSQPFRWSLSQTKRWSSYKRAPCKSTGATEEVPGCVSILGCSTSRWFGRVRRLPACLGIRPRRAAGPSSHRRLFLVIRAVDLLFFTLKVLGLIGVFLSWSLLSLFWAGQSPWPSARRLP
jgi:hypothetical protein